MMNVAELEVTSSSPSSPLKTALCSRKRNLDHQLLAFLDIETPSRLQSHRSSRRSFSKATKWMMAESVTTRRQAGTRSLLTARQNPF